MSGRLPPHFIQLVQDALLKSFWTKDGLKAFLRRSHVSDNFLATLEKHETKRAWLDRLFPKLETTDRGQALIQQVARSLAEQKAFPDLKNWENSVKMVADASEAIAALREYLDQKDEEKTRQEDIVRARQLAADAQARNQRAQSDLSTLRERLDALGGRLGEQQAGYDFEKWFYDLMDYFDIDNRRPYESQGRQIDGSVTIDGTTFLVELKFEGTPTSAKETDSLTKKVGKTALCTMGIMVAISSYTANAKDEASTANSPLLLLDHSHLYMVLTAICNFEDLVRRVRRHASQEGSAYLPVDRFGG